MCSKKKEYNHRHDFATLNAVPWGSNISSHFLTHGLCMKGKKVKLTYDRHTAQWGDERCWSKAIGSKVPQFPDTHENHTAPPHCRGVIRLGATLSLTNMGIFLLGRGVTEVSKNDNTTQILQCLLKASQCKSQGCAHTSLNTQHFIEKEIW